MPLEGIEGSRTLSFTQRHHVDQKARMTAFGSRLGKVVQAGSDTDLAIGKNAPIDYNSYRSVKSFGSRVRFIVMHYTAADFKTSVDLLTQGAASAHYLVPSPADPSYLAAGHREVKIFNLVDEKERAWHAGVSHWRGRDNLNDTSIGIEIVNQATDDNGHFTFPPFDPQQIAAVNSLAANIIQRYPDISPVNVVGHSDIAPGRKSDPGASFPWQQLAEAGVGAWYDEGTKEKYITQFSKAIPGRDDIISQLKSYGYDTTAAKTSQGFTALIRAFQLHFRPCEYNGDLDVETAAILYALVEKYSPSAQ